MSWLLCVVVLVGLLIVPANADTLYEARTIAAVACVVRIESHDKRWRAEIVEGCLPAKRLSYVKRCAALKTYAAMQPGQTYREQIQVIKEIEAVRSCSELDPPPVLVQK